MKTDSRASHFEKTSSENPTSCESGSSNMADSKDEHFAKADREILRSLDSDSHDAVTNEQHASKQFWPMISTEEGMQIVSRK
jgi:hypothetical protein